MEYSEYLLSDVLDISWGDTKTTKAKYVEDGFIAFSASGPDGFLPYFDFEQTGVVLSAIGANCGKTYLAEGQWSCIKNTMRMIAKSDEMSVDYFYYLSQQSDFFPIRGSAQPFISQTDIRELRVSLPNRVVQDAIVGIIKLLDEKIRLNTEISKTLEAIAQTIFKSWFIDFDPVHAKMRGEKPEGMDDATAALFPDSFEESELGLIPKGWEVRQFGEMVTKQKPGKLYDQKSTSLEGAVPVLDQGKSGFVGFHDSEPGVNATPENPYVVFANHTCSLRMVSYPFSCIQNVFPLLGNNLEVFWLYFALKDRQKFESYKGHWPDFIRHKSACPSMHLTKAFRATIESMMKES